MVMDSKAPASQALGIIRLVTAKLMADKMRETDNPADGVNMGLHSVVNAAEALMTTFFHGDISYNDRFVFTVAMAMAGLDAKEVEGDKTKIQIGIEVSPKTIREACLTYTKLTGKDIMSHLPETLVDYLNKDKANLH